MRLQISPETEKLVEEEIASGRFGSLDEIVRSVLPSRIDRDDQFRRHRAAMDRTRKFTHGDPIRLQGVTFQEVIEEGRRL